MALTEEQFIQQINVLTKKTSENPDMVYKTTAALNKALDPEIFSGNNTTIVNAINKLGKELVAVKTLVNDVVNKINSVLLDVNGEANKELWEDTQKLMGNETIIEGIKHLLEGNLQHHLLGLDIKDEGKVVTIAKDEDGNPVLKAVDAIIGGGTVVNPNVYNLLYTNKLNPEINSVGEALDILMEEKDISAYKIDYVSSVDSEINNVGEAIDKLLNVVNDIGALSVLWEHIEGKPAIAEELVMDDQKLSLVSEEGVEMSSVLLTTNEDIDNILTTLDN